MDKKFQDIHYINPACEEVFVMRQVHINEINMHETSIEIFINTINPLTGETEEKLACVFLPKLKGYKLVID